VVQRKDRVDEVLEVALRWGRVLVKIRGHDQVSMWIEKRRGVAIRYVLVLCLLCLGVAGRDVKVARFAAGGASCKWLVDMLQCKAQGFVLCTYL
jgi:hypothetical protein